MSSISNDNRSNILEFSKYNKSKKRPFEGNEGYNKLKRKSLEGREISQKSEEWKLKGTDDKTQKIIHMSSPEKSKFNISNTHIKVMDIDNDDKTPEIVKTRLSANETISPIPIALMTISTTEDISIPMDIVHEDFPVPVGIVRSAPPENFPVPSCTVRCALPENFPVPMGLVRSGPPENFPVPMGLVRSAPPEDFPVPMGLVAMDII